MQRRASDAVRPGYAFYGESRGVKKSDDEDGFPIKNVGKDSKGRKTKK
jgi:hypothetical protein